MKRTVLLLAFLPLTGCALLAPGPDPSLVASKPAIVVALHNDTLMHPDHKAANEAAEKVLADKTKEPVMAPSAPEIADTITGIGGLLTTVPGLTAVGAVIAGVGGILHSILTSKKVMAVAGAVDQHAALIDSVTPEAADSASKASAS
jgi:hypothetical protein